VLVGYPSEEEEYVIVSRVTGAAQAVARVATTEQLLALQKKVRELYVDPSLLHYAVKVVAATREPEKAGLADAGRLVVYGASPRATIGMIEAGRALAFLRGRDYVLPEDVVDVTPDVLRHRVVLSYEALSDGTSADDLIRQILKAVPRPEKVLQSHVHVA
jgi:MoxR-like ATPase